MIAAAGALSEMVGERLTRRASISMPRPIRYKMEKNWAQLGRGRKFGAAIKVQIDHSDGRASGCSTGRIPPTCRSRPDQFTALVELVAVGLTANRLGVALTSRRR
jgi:hypothetical protein